MRRLLYLALVLLAACEAVPTVTPPGGQASGSPEAREAERATRQFVEVASTLEPVVESECRRLTSGLNCDFLIVVDDRMGDEPNAFQTLDRNGRPILAFNIPLIASVQNADELAFVMGHESSHHILGHLARVEEDAAVGALIFSGIASMSGATAADVRSAEEFGASVGARTFSKEYELEADQLGTILTMMAGYDPVRGAEFFMRIPDPGDRFLGTHPPNSARIAIVRRTAAAYAATN
ncbi:MAG: M48 family metalloprotease [Rhodobacteraceae bacterium]|uniref:M48 family metallopeptidase n=1 Tax=Salipiger thiooxidans TaxID=282683 RepID=UPI001A8DC74A|nr:M48 family metallopeptidase [Salipiger thiooxidans]MBN8185349.1 M48 family metallopeptidase [Salipiger thiooxidans]MBR9837281.1 M48 family metalloprotease [Paracoccaceae bacterium]